MIVPHLTRSLITLRAARPVAPRLARLLHEGRPVLRAARPALAATAALLPDVATVLRGLPALQRVASPAFESTTASLRGTASAGPRTCGRQSGYCRWM